MKVMLAVGSSYLESFPIEKIGLQGSPTLPSIAHGRDAMFFFGTAMTLAMLILGSD